MRLEHPKPRGNGAGRIGTLAGVGAAIFLGACAAPVPNVITPGYVNAVFKQRTVHLFPPRELTLENPRDYETVLAPKDSRDSAEQARIIGRLCFRALAARMARVLAVYDSAWDPGTGAYRDTVLDLPGYAGAFRGKYRFPGAKALQDSGLVPDLGLQLQRMRFEHDTSFSGSMGGGTGPAIRTPGGTVPGAYTGGGSVTRHEGLKLTGYYLLWDYRADALVAYGRFKVEAGFLGEISDSDWNSVITQAMDVIVDQSPL